MRIHVYVCIIGDVFSMHHQGQGGKPYGPTVHLIAFLPITFHDLLGNRRRPPSRTGLRCSCDVSRCGVWGCSGAWHRFGWCAVSFDLKMVAMPWLSKPYTWMVRHGSCELVWCRQRVPRVLAIAPFGSEGKTTLLTAPFVWLSHLDRQRSYCGY